jgi:hypothetical protein
VQLPPFSLERSRTGADTFGLRQCFAGWSAELSASPSIQSVLNAAVRLVAGLRRSDHVTDTLDGNHRLRAAAERIQFKLATTFTACCTAHCGTLLPVQYKLQRLADMSSRSRLRSPSTQQLDWSPSCFETVDDSLLNL